MTNYIMIKTNLHVGYDLCTLETFLYIQYTILNKRFEIWNILSTLTDIGSINVFLVQNETKHLP